MWPCDKRDNVQRLGRYGEHLHADLDPSAARQAPDQKGVLFPIMTASLHIIPYIMIIFINMKNFKTTFGHYPTNNNIIKTATNM